MSRFGVWPSYLVNTLLGPGGFIPAPETIDAALCLQKPSDLPLVQPFKVTQDVEDSHFDEVKIDENLETYVPHVIEVSGKVLEKMN